MPSPADPRMPTERIPPSTGGEIARTLSWTLLMVVLANVAAGAFLARFTPNEGYRLIREKWALVDRHAEPIDWLILGDSSGNQGIDPAVFLERGQGEALNLCTIGDLLAQHDAWMLEEYLARAARPRQGVVISHVYDVWHRDVNAALLGKVPLPWGFWERLEPTVSLSAAQTRQLFLARFVPLWAESDSLAVAASAGPTVLSWPRTLDAAGFKAEDLPDESAVAKDAARHRSFTRKKSFRMSKVNAAALRRIVALAEEHQLDVYLVNSPLYEGLWEDSGFTAYYADVVAEIERHVADQPRVHLLLREPMTFPASELVNVDHLTASGAERFTGRVIEEIAASRRAAGPTAR